jgi:hypothetical protein
MELHLPRVHEQDKMLACSRRYAADKNEKAKAEAN